MKAALRDASFHSNPDARTVKRYHVFDEADGKPRCGRMSALCTEDALELSEVPTWQRCESNGCRQHWPAEE